ncbi:MAG: LemA family protein [Bacteroidota bacterium]
MKSITTVGILVGLFALLLVGGCSYNNGFVRAEEDIKEQWGAVQTQYQRRADLIGNLVETVRGTAEFERSTLESVVNARARATQTNVSADNLTPEALQQFQAAQGELSQGLGRLLVTVESYPQLQSTQAFRDLMTQLEGTENRIAVARQRFNEQVTSYNKKVRVFPASLFASILGFDTYTQFEADPGSEDAPQVNFDGLND